MSERNYLAIDTYERLVLTQGWPLARYADWLTRAITSALCAYEPGARRRTEPCRRNGR